MSGEAPQIEYRNPLYKGDPSVRAFVARAPLGYLATLALHLFAMLDHDFLFTYVADLHPVYRWPLQALNFLFLFFAARGIGPAIGKDRPSAQRLAAAAVLLAAAFSAAIYLPVEVESRFSLPVDLLITPFFAMGLLRTRQDLLARKRGVLLRLGAAAGVFLGLAFTLSSWIAAQANRLAGS